MKILAILSLFAALAACSPLGIVNALVPDGGYRVQRDIAYGTHERQKLDVYVPEQATGTLPVIVFFYGGSWQMGNRGDYKFAAEALASKGFVVVVPDYRVYPEVRYPAFMEDAAAAFAWAHREAGSFGGDARRMVVMGHSAGAHIATMLAYNERFLAAQGRSRSDVRAVIGLAGPYDFVPTDPKIAALLSGEGSTDAAMPARYVRGGEPATLLITGSADGTVSPGNQERLARRLTEVRSPVTARSYEGLNHVTVLGRLAAPIRRAELLEEIATFARRHSAPREGVTR